MTVAVTRLDLSARDLRGVGGEVNGCEGSAEDVGDCVGYGRVGPRGGGAELRDGPANLARLGVSLQCRGACGPVEPHGTRAHALPERRAEGGNFPRSFARVLTLRWTAWCVGGGIDLKHLIKERFGVVMHERTVGKQLAELGFRRLSVRPAHPHRIRPHRRRSKKNFAQLVAAALPPEARGKPLEIWFQDEARIGQQGTLTRVWARRGTRPRAPRDTRYKWAYIFGAVCPQRAAAAALVMPFADIRRR